MRRSKEFRGILRAEMLRGDDKIGPRFESPQTIFEKARDIIETDAAETDGGFIFACGVGNDDDGLGLIEDGAGPGGVLAVETDVDATGKMGRSKLIGLAGIEDLRALSL